MYVVVTGAAGFIGRHVVDILGRRGLDVVGIDRRHWIPDIHEDRLVADLANETDAVVEALRDADAVVHLAGRPGVRDQTPGIDRLRWRDNVLAGGVVLRHVPATTPLVMASSSSVYGGSNGRPCHEDDELRPGGGYARSKVELERRCARRRAVGGHVAVARPFTVAGEGQRPDMAVSRWISDARRGRPLTVLGGSDRSRDVTDVRHVAEGLVRMLEREVCTTVNLGTGRAHTLGDLIAAVGRALEVPVRTRIVPVGAAEPPATLADVSRCAELLDLVPVTDLDALVRRQVAALDTTPLVEAV